MDIETISRCMFLGEAPIDADAAIVFGLNDWTRPAGRAVQLYMAGRVRRLVFTGGYNARAGGIEAELMAGFAREAGVPDHAILVEPDASNTDENVVFSKALMEQKLGAGGYRTVLLITIHYHLRRTILAARRHLPPPHAIGWMPYPSRHYASDAWHLSERGRESVASELRKIETYYGLTLDDLASRQP